MSKKKSYLGFLQRFNPTSFIFLSFFSILFLINISAAEPSFAHNGKILDPNFIKEKFESGQTKVNVIINMTNSNSVSPEASFKSPHSLKKMRSQIQASQSRIMARIHDKDLKLRHLFENQPSFSAEVTVDGLAQLLDEPSVDFIEPVYILHPMLRQGISMINGSTVRSTYNGQGTAVAICDTGIDYTHQKLGGGGFPNSKVIGGYDFGDSDADPFPRGQAHGTACAGIAAGNLDDTGDYIGGVAYGAKIYALKISDEDSGSASSDSMIAAWDWCITHKDDDPCNPIVVISTSFGGGRNLTTCDSYVPAMTTAANNAAAAGIAVAVSSGNEGYCNALAWPACISSVISVGAAYDASFGQYPSAGYVGCISEYSCVGFTSNCPCKEKCFIDQTTAIDKVTTYSNSANFLTVFAPSNNAYTLDISGSAGYNSSGDYVTGFGGTSAACPYVAGAIACIQSASKDILGRYLTAAEIKNKLISTGNNIIDTKAGITKPRINLGQAIDTIKPLIPVAKNISISAQPAIAASITLDVTDDGLPNPPAALTYIITSLPSYGTLTEPSVGPITSNNLPYPLISYGKKVNYTPNQCAGQDIFHYKANDGGIAPDGGESNTATVTINVESLIYETDFSSGLPQDWSIIDGLNDGHTWSSINPAERENSNWTGNFMIIDSDWPGHVNMDEQLITSSFDCSRYKNIKLKFKHYFRYYSFGPVEIGDVDVKAGTGTWQNVAQYTGKDFSGQVELNISQIADGEPNVQIRWHYYNANFDWYWGIDDVKLTAAVDPISGDFNADCAVKLNDFSLIARTWLSTPGSSNWNQTFDISEPNDNLINELDLQIFISNWLETNYP